jgi:hypothetical protein
MLRQPRPPDMKLEFVIFYQIKNGFVATHLLATVLEKCNTRQPQVCSHLFEPVVFGQVWK